MKNIALIIYSLKGGGAERVASLLSKKLSEKHNIYLVLFNSDDIAYDYNGKLIDLNIKSSNNIIEKLKNVFLRVKGLRKIKKRYNIETSISFLGSSNIINILSKINDKVIISIHSYKSKRGNNFYEKLFNLTSQLYNKADEIITVSQGIKEDLIEKFNVKENKIKVIYNPIDLNEINKQALNQLEINIDYPSVVNMGRLNDAKGQWHLIRAFKKVMDTIPNAKLYILGEGKLRPYLERLIEEYNLNDKVFLLGFKKEPFKYIKKSDLFVLTSLYEGFGNVLVETMACNIPIISTDCKSGPREILAPNSNVKEIKSVQYEKYGILIPVCDGIKYDINDNLTKEELILADTIINTLKNKELLKKYKEVDKDIEKYTLCTIIKQWEKII